MRILLISSSSGSRGGGEIFLLSLAQELTRLGHTAGLWCATHPRMDELARKFAAIGTVLRHPYVNTYDHPLRSAHYLFDRSLPPAILQQWASFHPDILHLNKQNTEDGLDLLTAIHESQIPALATIHITQSCAELGSRLAKLRDWTTSRIFRRHPLPSVAVSPVHLSERFSRRMDFLQVTNIFNGVPLPEAATLQTLRNRQRTKLGIAASTPLFLALGRLEAQKRPLLFLDWARSILGVLPQARFFWVGDGSMKKAWDRTVETHNLKEYVTQIPWSETPLEWLAAADLFLHPAAYEGMPLALLEAMSCGLPCLVSKDLAEDQDYLNQDNALIIETQNPAWTQALTDPERLKILGQQARQFIAQRHTTTHMAEGYLSFYQQCHAKGRAQASAPHP